MTQTFARLEAAMNRPAWAEDPRDAAIQAIPVLKPNTPKVCGHSTSNGRSPGGTTARFLCTFGVCWACRGELSRIVCDAFSPFFLRRFLHAPLPRRGETEMWVCVKVLQCRFDVNTLHRDESAAHLAPNDIGRVTPGTTAPPSHDGD